VGSDLPADHHYHQYQRAFLPVNRVASLLASSIGKKWIVALTGLVLVGFVFGHMAGNLQVFLGPEALNAYGAFLHSSAELLWIVRLVLLASVALHIWFTIQLWRENQAARPVKYAAEKLRRLPITTSTMRLSGITLGLFIVFHLLHFTTRSVVPEWDHWTDAENRHDVYRMVIAGFQNPLTSVVYAAAMIMLAGHLGHGISSLTQTLGVRTKGFASLFSAGGRVLAAVVAIGYLSIPLAVMLGMGAEYVEEREKAAEAKASVIKPADHGKGPSKAH
jgi:succinate dehydrogenase / fumarate reductase cytochrome b subunit